MGLLLLLQIISLGAGFDSCFFRLGSEDLLNNTVYIEVWNINIPLMAQVNYMLTTICYNLYDLGNIHLLIILKNEQESIVS